MKKTPLRRTSKKQANRLRVYYRLRKEYLSAQPICEVCQRSSSSEIHHVDKRGPNLNRVETWMAVCRPCHRRIEEKKSWARKNGYLS